MTLKSGFMYKMFNLKLHVPCIFLFERLKPRKTTMKMKIHFSTYLDDSQPNVDNTLDKNVNMTKFVFQSISLDKSLELLPTKTSF